MLQMLLLTGVTQAQTPAVDLQALTNELQIMRQDDGMRMVFWMPREYWDVSMAGSIPSAENRAKALSIMDDYEIIAVISGKVGLGGVLLGASREDLMKSVTVKMADTTLQPLTQGELSNEMNSFLKTMQPVLAGLLGQFGQSMQLLVFKGADSAGKRLLDPQQAGSFAVMLGDEAFQFRLPLGSLLPPKFDASSSEQFPGNYNFNPYTGKQLTTK